MDKERQRILEIIKGHRPKEPSVGKGRRDRRLQNVGAPPSAQELDKIKKVLKAEKERRNKAENPASP
jgi:hypothetical protein